MSGASFLLGIELGRDGSLGYFFMSRCMRLNIKYLLTDTIHKSSRRKLVD